MLVEHYNEEEQTIQFPCMDGREVSFHVEEETSNLRITVWDAASEPLFTVQVSSEIATGAILALNRPNFLRALGV